MQGVFLRKTVGRIALPSLADDEEYEIQIRKLSS